MNAEPQNVLDYYVALNSSSSLGSGVGSPSRVQASKALTLVN